MKKLFIALSLLVVPVIAFSAIGGGGEPGIKLSIFRGELRQVGLSHNVDRSVIRTPQEAAVIIAAGGSCYVNSVGAKAWEEVRAILRERGLVE